MMTGYRRDIDGLRAVAILPVLFYHCGISLFSGGFVGVDVFFVISGYLIAGIIAREIDGGKFSIIRFYERRARRILPALVAMIAFVFVGAAILYFPGDFSGVPTSALAANFFVSNMWFYTQTGYFAGGAETMPLLHTWSLAVEEQFYIGFPLLLLLIARYKPGWRNFVLALCALASLAWAIATQSDNDGVAFYWLPPRAWELLAGALLAVGAIPQVKSILAREVVSMLGLAAIALAVFNLNAQSAFPGVNALWPVLGTVALIHCAPGTWAGRLLETRAMVGVGLVSYSLYLWHWPVVVFAEYALDMPLEGLRSAIVILVSLLLAILSWRFIERPFRHSDGFNQKAIFKMSAVAMVGVAAIGGLLLTKGGWPERFSPEVLALENARNDVSPARDHCMYNDIGAPQPQCTLGAKTAPSALVWGDSHGVEYAWFLGERLKFKGKSLLQRTRGSCPAVFGYSAPKDPVCLKYNNHVMQTILANPRLETIVLTGYWASDFYGANLKAKDLDKTVAMLIKAKKKVIFIGPVAEQEFQIPRYLARLAQFHQGFENVGTSRTLLERKTARFSASFDKWRAAGVTIIEPANILCRKDFCPAILDGKPLYFDSHHPTLSAAQRVVESIPLGE